MSKDVLLRINPPVELQFKGPFSEVSTTSLRLTNIAEKPVCFKVKTTAPKQYCVRPNAGILSPNNSVDVQVMLQPNDFDMARALRHKFMVQAAFARPDGKESDDIWKNSAVHDTKLKCSFDMADNEATASSPSASAPMFTSGGNEAPDIYKTLDDPSPPPSAYPAVTSDLSVSPGLTSASSTPQHTRPAVTPSRKTEEGSFSHSKTGAAKEILESKMQELEKRNKQLQQENASLRQRKPGPQPVGGSEVRTATVSTEESTLPMPVLVLLALIIGLIIGKLLF